MSPFFTNGEGRSGGSSKFDPSQFDIDHGISSVAVTTQVAVVITTTAVGYHGLAMVASASGGLITIYDNSNTASGNILDTLLLAASVSTRVDLSTPIRAKIGIVAHLTNGTGAIGTVYFAPKG